MSEITEKIKDKLDVVSVLSDYIKVQKSGVNFKARCPFHNEKTPSFYISPERQIWHCFGCAKGGDIFGFIQEIEGIEFPEALRVLAQKAGVQLEAYNASNVDARAKLFEICEIAVKFFEKQLHGSASGLKALGYLKGRGLQDETIKEFRLGFAPNDWQALSTFLGSCGYANKDIVDAGIAINNSGRVYDRFRSRIIFPIADANGQVVGFTGRVFEVSPNHQSAGNAEVAAKYINTPQTAIYDKSRVLYGFHKARNYVRQADRCLLVEGNMDALMSYQAGVKNVVATSGTALTPQHLSFIRRFTDNLDVCFDTDQAGALATRRGIGLALSQNFNIKVVSINQSDIKDPADYVQRHGQAWAELVAASKPVVDFYFEKARIGYDGSPESKKSMIQVLAPLLRRLVSQVEKSHWVVQLAHFLRTKEEAVEADIAAAKDDLAAYDSHTPSPVAVTAKVAVPGVQAEQLSILEETFLSLIMRNPQLFKEELAAADLKGVNPRLVEMVQSILNNQADIDVLLTSAEEKEKMALEFAHLKSQELWKDFPDEALKLEFKSVLSSMYKKKIIQQLATLEFDMKQAEVTKDKDKIASLMQQFTQLAGQLAVIQKNGS